MESILGSDEYSVFVRHLINRLKNLCDERRCAALCAKAILELAIQMLYMSQFEPSKRMSVLSRWARRGASFSISMLAKSRGVPGPVKRRVLRAYLRVAEYVHPSPSGFQEPGSEELARVAEAVKALIKYIKL